MNEEDPPKPERPKVVNLKDKKNHKSKPHSPSLQDLLSLIDTYTQKQEDIFVKMSEGLNKTVSTCSDLQAATIASIQKQNTQLEQFATQIKKIGLPIKEPRYSSLHLILAAIVGALVSPLVIHYLTTHNY